MQIRAEINQITQAAPLKRRYPITFMEIGGGERKLKTNFTPFTSRIVRDYVRNSVLITQSRCFLGNSISHRGMSNRRSNGTLAKLLISIRDRVWSRCGSLGCEKAFDMTAVDETFRSARV